MDGKRRARWIAKILAKMYPKPAIPLEHTDPYTLLIAVLLSAQCTDARVNRITPELFSHADTPEKMVELSVDEILDIIRPCGLGPRKAQAIWSLSRQLIEKYGGNVPRTFHELEALPGVGHKTASVVMSQGFGIAAFPVDTHIHRCAKRWGLSEGKNVKQTEDDLRALFPKRIWNRLHLQMIAFAREHCQARRHNEKLCPICSGLRPDK